MPTLKDPPGIATEERIDQAVCRALIYDLLAMSLRPPTWAMLSHLKEDGAYETVLDAARALEDPEAGAAMGSSLERLFEALRDVRLDILEESYQRVFERAAREHIALHESEYGAGASGARRELAGIRSVHRAFGLGAADSLERNDHIAAELELLSLLATREAYEVVDGDEDGCAAVRRAERLFLQDHAARFGRAFGRALARSKGHPLYKAAGELCLDFLTSECARFEVTLDGESQRPLSPLS